MAVTLPLLAHDQAVVAALAVIGRPVGLVVAPAGALDAVRSNPPGPGYLIVYPLGADRSGPIGDAYADADLTYQVTAVARTYPEVRWLLERVETALQAVSVDGRSSQPMQPIDTVSAPDQPDNDVSPPVFAGFSRWRLLTYPI